MGKYEVLNTDVFDEWFVSLDTSTAERVVAAVEALEELGPAARRPLVGKIEGSQHANMKELRTGNIRILFVFDPVSNAVLLVGGDKTGQWRKWYQRAIPQADELYDQYLERTRKERDR